MTFRKSLFCIFLGMLLLLTVNASSESLTSIQQIIETTPERWTETYETEWRTIEVDTEIIVPDVETFPIVKVQSMPKIDDELLAEYSTVTKNRTGAFQFDKLKDDYLHNNWGYKTIDRYGRNEIPTIRPENVTISFEEAEALAFSEINRLWGLDESDFLLTTLRITSCVYQYTEKNGVKTWGKAVSEQGRYHFYFEQIFHGIEMEGARECYETYLTEESPLIAGFCGINFSSTLDNAKIRAILLKETEVVYEDVPLLTFSAAKEAIEQEIYAGHLRTVDEVKLCYISYLDPNDTSVRWLLPAWYVIGDYTRDPEQEYKYIYDEYTGEEVDNGFEKHEVVFQAQAGTLLDYKDTRKTRRQVIDIITWEQVGQ